VGTAERQGDTEVGTAERDDVGEFENEGEYDDDEEDEGDEDDDDNAPSPQEKGQRWTKAEDTILKRAVEEHNVRHLPVLCFALSSARPRLRAPQHCHAHDPATITTHTHTHTSSSITTTTTTTTTTTHTHTHTHVHTGGQLESNRRVLSRRTV
jgi:hypothetical protein